MGTISQARCIKRPSPQTPHGSGQTKRWFHRSGAYRAGRNALKRVNRRESILLRLRERGKTRAIARGA